MTKRILIPNDLWNFVGNELFNLGYMATGNVEAYNSTLERSKR